MKKVGTLDDVKDETRRIIRGHRPRPREPDVTQWQDEIEVLLGGIREFMPVWTVLPSVFRVARVDTGGTTAEFTDNVALPAARHTIQLVVEMLNYIREARGLEKVTMPLFLQPGDIERAREGPAECHCDEEREVAARARSWTRLGRRGSKRWLHTGQDVLDRDRRKCTRCGASRDLHVHTTGEGTKWTDPAGYATLCRRCHVVESGDPSPAAAALRFHLGDAGLEGPAIRSQLALVFEKGSLCWVGLAVGREYVVFRT